MTTTLTGTDSYSNTATAPADGDTRNAASVNTPLQTILNNTRFLYKHGRIISIASEAGGMLGTHSTSYTTADSWTISNCEVGDIIIAVSAMDFEWVSDSVDDTDAQVKISFTENAVEYDGKIVDTASTATSDSIECTLLGARTVATAGSVVVAVKSKIGTANGILNYTQFNNEYTIIVQVRP